MLKPDMNSDISKAMGLLRMATVIATVAAVMVLYRCHVPGRSDYMNLGLQLLLLAAIGWLLGLGALQKANFSTTHRASGRVSLVALPVLITMSALALTPLPQHVAFELSRPQLEQLAQNLSARNHGSEVHVLVGLPVMSAGLFDIDTYATDDDGGVYLVTSHRADQGQISSDGFAFKPGAPYQPLGSASFASTLRSEWLTFTAMD